MLARPRGPRAAKRKNDRHGATALECLFCLSLIIVVCIAAVRYVGGTLKESFSRSSDEISRSSAESRR